MGRVGAATGQQEGRPQGSMALEEVPAGFLLPGHGVRGSFPGIGLPKISEEKIRTMVPPQTPCGTVAEPFLLRGPAFLTSSQVMPSPGLQATL